jgi:hypothetical protein
MGQTKRVVANIFLIFAAILPQPALAADWKYLTSTSTGTQILVDVSSLRQEQAVPIRRPFSVIRIWVKHDHESDKSTKDRSTVQLMSINCQNDTSMVVTSVTYSASGEVKSSRTVEDYDFRYTPDVPDTIGFSITQFACGRTSLF